LVNQELDDNPEYASLPQKKKKAHQLSVYRRIRADCWKTESDEVKGEIQEIFDEEHEVKSNGSESEEDEDNDDDNNDDDNDEKNLLRHQQEYVFLLSISLQLLKFISDPLITLVRLSRPFFKIAAKQLGLLGSSLVEAWTNWGKSKSLCMQPPLLFFALSDFGNRCTVGKTMDGRKFQDTHPNWQPGLVYPWYEFLQQRHRKFYYFISCTLN